MEPAALLTALHTWQVVSYGPTVHALHITDGQCCMISTPLPFTPPLFHHCFPCHVLSTDSLLCEHRDATSRQDQEIKHATSYQAKTSLVKKINFDGRLCDFRKTTNHYSNQTDMHMNQTRNAMTLAKILEGFHCYATASMKSRMRGDEETHSAVVE